MSGEVDTRQQGPVEVEEPVKREKWGKAIDFLLSCIGFSVGLGNVWRFPYLCYKNGGGAFLIPYFVAVFLGGIPIFFLEVSLGQMMARGGIEAWNILPICKGIGVAQILIVFFLFCYYNVILSWSFYYFWASFTSRLPWSHCSNDWNTAACTVTGVGQNSTLNASIASNRTFDSVIEFWEKKVLGISEGIEYMGNIKWDLALCLLLGWIVVFFCIIKGIKSSGKVMYVTATSPYLFMLVLLIRAATLEGAVDGLKFYMTPNMTKIKEAGVWVDAGTQIFFSMSISLGTLPALGSYNKFHHNSLRDCFLFALVNCGTSLFAGFVIFMTLGYMAHLSNLPISEVAASGPGLAFIAYPKALATMPVAPLWSVFFFLMVILLGLDSQFVSVEGFITAITDLMPAFMARKWHREIFTLITCIIGFFVGLSMVTNGGMYVFQLFDYYSGSRIILVVGALQCLVLMYFYGGNRYSEHIRQMFWYPKAIEWVFKIMWGFVSPVYVMVIFILSALVYQELTYKKATATKTYTFPTYAVALGWTMAGVSMTLVPLVAIYKYCRAEGTFMERMRYLLTPQYPQDSPLSPDYGREPTAPAAQKYQPYVIGSDPYPPEKSSSKFWSGRDNDAYTLSTTSF